MAYFFFFLLGCHVGYFWCKYTDNWKEIVAHTRGYHKALDDWLDGGKEKVLKGLDEEMAKVNSIW